MAYSELKVTGEDFGIAIENAGHTRRSFAAVVTAQLAKPPSSRNARRRSDDPTTCSYSLISQLVNEVTRNTHPARARAIEAALGRPRELFVLRMSYVPQDSRTA